MERELELRLQEFSQKIAKDSEYAAAFRKLSLQEKGRELLSQGFTHADIGSLITDMDQAKDISVQAGTFWVP